MYWFSLSRPYAAKPAVVSQRMTVGSGTADHGHPRGRPGLGRRLMALFACTYHAALRPAEAVGLRLQDRHLPLKGWGRLTADVPRPQVDTRWTDGGDAPGNATSSMGAVTTCVRRRFRRRWSRSPGAHRATVFDGLQQHGCEPQCSHRPGLYTI